LEAISRLQGIEILAKIVSKEDRVPNTIPSMPEYHFMQVRMEHGDVKLS